MTSCSSPAEAIESLRARCESGDGCAVLLAVRDYMLQDPQVPAWLRDCFVRHYARVGDAQVASWDEAFGRPFPRGTRIAILRRDRTRLRLVHEAVWAQLRRNPKQAIDAKLFELAARDSNLACSGATVRNLYYRAINEHGLLNLAEYKQAMLRQAKVDAVGPPLDCALPVFASERLNGFGEANRRT